MSRTGSFDWYQLSKLDSSKPNIQQFASLIKHAHFGQQVSKVPTSLRLKLLKAFQNVSKEIKMRYEQELEQVDRVQVNKRVVAEKINVMKQELEYSMNKINTDKIVIEEKKKTIAKLKQKLKKKQAKANKEKTTSERSVEIYFCPFCTRQDFPSRDEFTFHMFKEHSKSIHDLNQNPSQQSITSINSQVKQLILTLKDKEIELMEMMLNKKKEMEFMELQYAYTNDIRKVRTQANFLDRKTDYLTNYQYKHKSQQEDQSQELKGQSQYLFYPHSDRKIEPQYNRYNNKIHGEFYEDEHYKPQYPRPSQPIQQVYHQPTYPQRRQGQKNDYYNIFSSEVAISHSDNNFSPQKPEQNVIRNKYYQEEREIQSQSWLPTSQFKQIKQMKQMNKNLSWNQEPSQLKAPVIQPTQVHQVQSKLFNFTQNVDKKISSNEESDKKYETFYKPSKTNISHIDINDGHIFNSGPLMDDVGDGSDYQDYFGAKHNKNSADDDEVIDEQIKITRPKFNLNLNSNQSKDKFINKQIKKQTTSINVVKPNQNLSINSQSANMSNQSNILLQYSRDKSMLQISNSKQKSSDLIDLSNSFSKRELESSKNNDETINLSDLKLSKLQRERQRFKKEKEKIVEQEYESQNSIAIPQISQFRKSIGNPSLLEQFKRQPDLQLKMEKMNINRTQKPKIISTASIKMPTNIEFLQANPRILDQFFVKSVDNQNQ